MVAPHRVAPFLIAGVLAAAGILLILGAPSLQINCPPNITPSECAQLQQQAGNGHNPHFGFGTGSSSGPAILQAYLVNLTGYTVSLRDDSYASSQLSGVATAVQWGDSSSNSFAGFGGIYTHAYASVPKSYSIRVCLGGVDGNQTYQNCESLGVTLGVSHQYNVTCVNAGNCAFAQVNFNYTLSGTTAMLTDITSVSNGGSVRNISWRFGDGSVGYGSKVTHTFQGPGTYLVTENVSWYAVQNQPQTATSAHSVNLTVSVTGSTSGKTNQTIAATTGSALALAVGYALLGAGIGMALTALTGRPELVVAGLLIGALGGLGFWYFAVVLAW